MTAGSVHVCTPELTASFFETPDLSNRLLDIFTTLAKPLGLYLYNQTLLPDFDHKPCSPHFLLKAEGGQRHVRRLARLLLRQAGKMTLQYSHLSAELYGRTPFVLRRREGRLVVLGECYVHRIIGS